jgi:hypothetical protein
VQEAPIEIVPRVRGRAGAAPTLVGELAKFTPTGCAPSLARRTTDNDIEGCGHASLAQVAQEVAGLESREITNEGSEAQVPKVGLQRLDSEGIVVHRRHSTEAGAVEAEAETARTRKQVEDRRP